MSKTQELTELGLVEPPKFLPAHVHYETQVGSVAYGVSQDSSDMDVYGFCIPPVEMIFPHLAGEIMGFGRQVQRFEQFQKHGVPADHEQRVYDLTIYSIVKYFSLCMENNPNMLESLFTPERCVLTCSPIAARIREHRHLFLHKGAWHKFKGFAYSQIHKMKIKQPDGGKRFELVERFGFDVKFAYHAVRLMDEARQILTQGELTLDGNIDKLIGIRRGEWTQEEVERYFEAQEKELELLYEQSTLPYSPREDEIKTLLLESLEEAYGSLEGCIVRS